MIIPISAKEIGPVLSGSLPDLENTKPLSTVFFHIS